MASGIICKKPAPKNTPPANEFPINRALGLLYLFLLLSGINPPIKAAAIISITLNSLNISIFIEFCF